MKKCLLILGTLICINLYSQETHRVYCELLGVGKLLSEKVTVKVDFGQEVNYWTEYYNQFLVDENGKKITFNSMVDAMNYMGKFGWKFEQAYVITTAYQNVYHWLLSKDITDDEEINEGITTRQQFKDQQLETDEESNNESSERAKKKKRRRKVTDDIYM